MPDRKFAVVHDQSGDTKEVTINEFPDLQAKGYRVADTAGYDAAMSKQMDEPGPGEQAMAEQGSADASRLAEEQYPEAKPSGADKPKAAKKGE